MLPDKKIKCPYTGFTKTCFDGVTKHARPKWIHVTGLDPQGGTVDCYDCSDAWIPKLLIENSQQQRHTAGSIDSFRNEMMKLNSGPQPLLLN
jgi:hypothetical protein